MHEARPYIVVEEGYSYKHRSCYDYSWVHALSAFIDSLASSPVKRPAAMNSYRCLWAAALATGPSSTAMTSGQSIGSTGRQSFRHLSLCLRENNFSTLTSQEEPPGDG